MTSILKVDELQGSTGSTITVPSGQTLDVSNATVTGLPAPTQPGLVHITTVNMPTDSSTLDIPGCFTADYDTYKVVINDVKPNTNTVHIEMQFGNADLTSIYTRYQYVMSQYSASVAHHNFYHDNSNSSTGIRLANDMSNSSVYGCNFTLDIHNPYKVDLFTSFHGSGWAFNNSANYANTFTVSGNTMSADVSDRDESLRIYPQSGTLKGETTAHVSVFGYYKG